jgi:hypothetical protein
MTFAYPSLRPGQRRRRRRHRIDHALLARVSAWSAVSFGSGLRVSVRKRVGVALSKRERNLLAFRGPHVGQLQVRQPAGSSLIASGVLRMTVPLGHAVVDFPPASNRLPGFRESRFLAGQLCFYAPRKVTSI